MHAVSSPQFGTISTPLSYPNPTKPLAHARPHPPTQPADLAAPRSVAVDGNGNLYISDSGNNAIRMVDPAGTITTVAGDGNPGFAGDGGPAIVARISFPFGIAVDALKRLYICDSNNRIRFVNSVGVMHTIAGDGNFGAGGDGGPANLAQLNMPSGITVDGAGKVTFTDTSNHRVRRISC